MEYIPKSPNQYTEQKMKQRVKKMRLKLWWHKGFDILVAHSPAYHINDLEDLPHRGFKVFRTLMEKYEPKFFFHGHVHSNYSRKFKRTDKYEKTTIVNAYEYSIVEYRFNEEN